MVIFLTLLLKLLPLYLIIFLGFIAGRYLNVKKESISPLLIYIIAPLVIFNGVVTTHISIASLSLPILFYFLTSCICVSFYYIAKRIWKDSTKNILAFTAGTGNTGYFGLPVALVLFNERLTGLVVMAFLGFVLYESTVGFFITAKGKHTTKESLMKVFKLPTLYAFMLGLVVNLTHTNLGQIYQDNIINFRGAYTVLGMMLIGLGLSSIKSFKFDFKFVGLSFFAKFIVWPLIIGSIILLDNNLFNFYNSDFHKVMILMSIVPLAANTVAYATQLNAQPEKASFAVLLSTIFALFYIPIMVILFF